MTFTHRTALAKASLFMLVLLAIQLFISLPPALAKEVQQGPQLGEAASFELDDPFLTDAAAVDVYASARGVKEKTLWPPAGELLRAPIPITLTTPITTTPVISRPLGIEAGLLSTQNSTSTSHPEWKPDFSLPTVSQFNMSASYAYPVFTPPGANGLQPDLNLYYNSNSLNSSVGPVAATPLGFGWSLGSEVDIRMSWTNEGTNVSPLGTQTAREFYLNLGGSNHELLAITSNETDNGKPMRYFAIGETDLFVELCGYATSATNTSPHCKFMDNIPGESDGLPNNGLADDSGKKTKLFWVVVTPDGTRYRLGYKGNSEQERLTGVYDDWKDSVDSALSWRVDLVVDRYGNKMNYSYMEYERCKVNSTTMTHFINSHIQTITYSSGGLNPDSYTVEYEYDNLADPDNYDCPGSSAGETGSRVLTSHNKKLTKLLVKTNGSITRQYDLTYTSRRHGADNSLYNQVTQMAACEAVQYDNAIAERWAAPTPITIVEKFGSGGAMLTSQASVSIHYQFLQTSDSVPHTGGYIWCRPYLKKVIPQFSPTNTPIIEYAYLSRSNNNHVREKWFNNGYGDSSYAFYDYINAVYNPSGLMGFANSSVSYFDQQGGNLLKVDHYAFISYGDAGYTDWYDNEPGKRMLVGKPLSEVVMDAEGKLIAETTYQWIFQTNGSYKPFLVEKSTRDEYGAGTHTKYFRAFGGAFNFFVTQLIEEQYAYSNQSTLLRKSVTDYVYNLSLHYNGSEGFLANVPKEERVYDGTNVLIGKTRYRYDNAGCTSSALSKTGYLTAVDVYHPGGGNGTCDANHVTTLYTYGQAGQGAAWQQTMVTDPKGNQAKTYWHDGVSVAKTVAVESGSVSHETQIQYNNAAYPWLMTDIIGPNGAQSKYVYDTFGRIQYVYGPTSSTGQATNLLNTFTYGDSSKPPYVEVLNGSGVIATKSRVYYDATGRTLQSHQAVHNGSAYQYSYQLFGYDSQGNLVCQTPAIGTANTTMGYSGANLCENRAEKVMTSYDVLGQAVQTENQGGISQDVVPGYYAQYSRNDGLRVSASYMDTLGRLAKVDEYNDRQVHTFDTYNAAEWGPSHGASQSSTVIGVSSGALYLRNNGGSNQSGVINSLSTPPGDADTAVAFDFSVDSTTGLTWFQLERGSWPTTYRSWGIHTRVEADDNKPWISLSRCTGSSCPRTKLLELEPNTTYEVILRTSKVANTSGSQVCSANWFAVVVWEKADPANRKEMRLQMCDPAASNYWLSDQWNFVAKSELAPNVTLTLDNFVEHDVYRTAYNYNSADQLTSVVDALGNTVSSMGYNFVGQKTSMSDMDMGSNWAYQYDVNGNLTYQKDANGNIICMAYNSMNRLETKWEGANNACGSPPAVGAASWLATYDYFTSGSGKGQLEKVRWPGYAGVDEESFLYNPAGQVTSHTRVINGRSYTMGYSNFDLLGRPQTITFPDGTTQTVTYDGYGENAVVGGGVSLVSNVSHNARGEMTGITRPQVANTVYIYNESGANFGRLQGIYHGASSDNYPDYTFTYDAVGNITHLTEVRMPVATSRQQVQTFTYDHLGRLESASAPAVSEMPPAYSAQYVYDAIGNIDQKTLDGVVDDYGYHATRKHAITSSNGWSYGYDYNGNMTSRSATGGAYSHTFDIENRLVSVLKDGSQTTTFYYDPSGQRTMTVEPDGKTTYYPFPNFEQEVSLSGNILVNPGFESGTTNWTPENLYSSQSTSYPHGSWGIHGPHSDTYGWGINNLMDGWLRSDLIEVTPNSQYEFTAWVRGELQEVDAETYWQMHVYYYDTSYNYLSRDTVATGDPSTISATWQQMGTAGTAAAPATAKYAALMLRISKGHGWINFDDVSFVKVGTSDNLAPNPDFEDGPTGWTAEDLYSSQSTSYPHGSWGIHGPHSGTYGWGINNLMDGWLRSDLIEVTPTSQYEFTAWIRGELQEVNAGTVWLMHVYYYDETYNYLSRDTVDSGGPTSISGTWQQMGTASIANAPTNAKYAALMLRISKGHGWINFDDVSFVKVGTSDNLAPNSDFEDGPTGWTAEDLYSSQSTSYPHGSWGIHGPHTGTYGWGINNLMDGWLRSDLIEVTPNSQYEFTAWVRGELQEFNAETYWQMHVYYYDASYNYLSRDTVATGDPSTISATWQQMGIGGIATAPASAKYAALMLRISKGHGWINFDDVTFNPMLSNTITRKTYLAAGQPIAINVSGDPTPDNNGLFYIYTDHLGSASTIVDSSDGSVKDETRFYPFGGYRDGSTGSSVTDRGFTGHQHNDDLGLIYMNARFYLSYISRHLTADSIIPDVTNPQLFNRYSYVNNNPLNLIDPTGHYGEDVHHDLTKKLGTKTVKRINNEYGLDLSTDLADVIADANQRTDTHWMTHPMNIVDMPFRDYGSWKYYVSPSEYYHFTSRDVAEGRLMWSIAEGDIEAFGRALHSFQDTFSHIESGYSFRVGFEGYLELANKCQSCIMGPSDSIKAMLNLGHFPFAAHESMPGYPDEFDIGNIRDQRMANGTEFWITLYILYQNNIDFDEYYQDLYGMTAIEWYQQNVEGKEE